jgi:hypothetical protein
MATAAGTAVSDIAIEIGFVIDGTGVARARGPSAAREVTP